MEAPHHLDDIPPETVHGLPSPFAERLGSFESRNLAAGA